ncbi:MAG: ABC transporter ATP-binding protein [Candidatus Velthaea sp.]|jgi:iron complex transport system ATP-binding protein
MIDVRDVALGYGGCRILGAVSLTVEAGELLALVGPNGIGKSTLLRAIGGMHPIESGTITLEGRAIASLGPRERGRRIALIEADGELPEQMSVADVVAGGRLPYRPWWRWSSTAQDRAAVDAALAETEIGALRGRRFAELSSGERQRVWVAQAVAQDTRVLLLDEPTSHLDIRHTFELLALVRRLVASGKSAVVVLHDLNVAAAFADRIALLGTRTLLACDTPVRILDEAMLSRVYGIPIAVRREADGSVFAFAVAPPRSEAPQPR